MRPAAFRVSIAASLDGYIATPDGGVKWLDPYFSPEIDFNAFTKQIAATIYGRKTFDQAMGMGAAASSKERTIVLTRRPLPAPARKRGVESWNPDNDDLNALAAKLRADLEPSGKDIWLMGGGQSIDCLRRAGLVDRWEISVIPILLGDGIPLFPKTAAGLQSLTLTKTKPYKNGIVELHYEPVASPASARTKPARSQKRK